MKKFITCFLIFALSLTSVPAQVFAQNINYKPAKSFEYDYFTLGKMSEALFIRKLKQDMYDNIFDEQTQPRYRTGEPSVKEAYNEFLYYSQYPKKSPYWKWTAFEPGQGATANDVLLILKKHQDISKEIVSLLKQSPRYKKQLETKWTLIITGGLMLALESYIIWAGVPFITSELTAFGIPAKGAKIATTIGALAYDMGVTFDFVPYTLRNLDGVKVEFDDADIYQSTTIENIKERNMLQSQIQNKQIKICSEAEKNYKNALEENIESPSIQEIDKWQPIIKFCRGNKKNIKDKQFRQDLGQYLIFAYSKLDAPDYHIEEARKELIAIYHALLFIKTELLQENDPLRFDRAMIDIITAYKVANITITDGRLIKMFKRPKELSQVDRLKTKGLTESDLNDEIDLEFYYSPDIFSYPTLLPRAQVNYIVQKMDIYNQKQQKKIDEEWEKSWNNYMKEHPYPMQK